MGNLRWLAVLMMITILAIAGFQVYWLRENYKREENSLLIRSQFTFRESVLELQVSKMISHPGDSASHEGLKVFIQKDGEPVTLRVPRPREFASRINVIREQLKDSIKSSHNLPGRIVTMDKRSVVTPDSLKVNTHIINNGKDRIFNLLYGVDSLQDTLKVAEIDSAYRKNLDKENLDIQFTVHRLDTVMDDDPGALDFITIGLTKPVTYKMELGNTFPYLMKRISLPILFSVVLLGITILSFSLLYRNLIRQKRLAEVKNEFISNITHELKTPIATVGVAIEALRDFNAMQDPQRTREYLDISTNELHRLGLLVDKVLKLSMFEKKEIGLKPEPVDLGSLADEVLASLKLQFEKHEAVVEVERKGNLDMEGDRLHLVSVIFNLLDNAIKYSRAAPRIQVEMVGKEDEIILSVRDNGIGIPPEYRTKVFEKFFRVPHGDTHNAKGYGLGLSYVAEVVRKHHGSITLEEMPGGGTAFIISLPKHQS